MENTVTERIKDVLIPKYGYNNLSAFGRLVGIPKTTLSTYFKRGNDPKVSEIGKIAKAIPEISLEWLILGIEPMLKSEIRKPQQDTNARLIETNAKLVDTNAKLVDTIAKMEEQLKKMGVSPVGIADAV